MASHRLLMVLALISVTIHLKASKPISSSEIITKKRRTNLDYFALLDEDDNEEDFIYNRSPDYEVQTLRNYWIKRLYEFLLFNLQNNNPDSAHYEDKPNQKSHNV
ncbi:unnamed protein product [Didymodactylos carnosus]|uniref:Uncharacterized protein n=1 Tax=Didymodactylos carnosus TaxID=1234261 RepID=A0A814S0F1_9BILA|nr:unnamed protein product [Didymodactylos carnosus]CAF1139775.1 unnamed protein product [Didymodactylos carnosus]CAF3842148.1 unnamed protein product [Didymodactylos carnosus]CAF3903543.1 unnamed protein product [Didymodactylos carnosus]